MTEIEHYKEQYFQSYKETILILRNAGFKPIAYTQMLCENTFVFKTKKECNTAFKLLGSSLSGWWYSQKDFNKALNDYKIKFNRPFNNIIYYVPYTQKQKASFRRQRLIELVGNKKSKFLEDTTIRLENRDIDKKMFDIAYYTLDRMEELNMSINLLAYKTDINLFDLKKLVRGHYNLTLKELVKLENTLNIKLCHI